MKVGWIGTGVMGLSMCKHLLNAQYSLAVYTRTPEKAQPLLELGAQWVSPQEMAASVDVLFLMLGFPKDVENMCLGEQGLLRHMKPGYVLSHAVQYWSTTRPVVPVSQSTSTTKPNPSEFPVSTRQSPVAMWELVRAN